MNEGTQRHSNDNDNNNDDEYTLVDQNRFGMYVCIKGVLEKTWSIDERLNRKQGSNQV